MKKLYILINKFAEYMEEYEPLFDQFDLTLPEPKNVKEKPMIDYKEEDHAVPFIVENTNKISIQ